MLSQVMVQDALINMECILIFNVSSIYGNKNDPDMNTYLLMHENSLYLNETASKFDLFKLSRNTFQYKAVTISGDSFMRALYY